MTTDPYRLIGRVQQVAHALRRRSDRALLDSAGITTAQAAVLAVISHAPGCSQRDVSRQLRLGEPAVVAAINRLLDAELVSRTRRSQDSRAAALSLTPRGDEALQRGQQAVATLNQLVLDALGVAGREQLSRLLDDLDRALDGDRAR